MMKDPFLAHKADVLSALGTNRRTGLDAATVTARQAEYGPNALPQAEKPKAWQQLLASLKEPMVIILFVAVALAWGSAAYDFFGTGNRAHGMAAIYESIAILILIALNAALAFWQARTAERSMAALTTLANHEAKVLRDGEWRTIPATELVPGDIVEVATGDFIEADVRWLHAVSLQVNEAHLTGEAEPVHKQTHAIDGEPVLGDRTNMGYSASMVTHGNGLGVVVATGAATEIGQIADLLASTATTKTPIERNVAQLSKRLLWVALGIVALMLGIELVKFYLATGTLSFTALAESLSAAIALAVAAIPDAMPAVLSIVLTIGAAQLARNQGLIKSLGSVETLGATSFIASDKTGTLTQNQMTVTRFWANGASYTVEGTGYEPTGEIIEDDAANTPGFSRFMLASVLNNEAAIEPDDNGRMQPYGNPTDVALVVMGEKAGVTRKAVLDKDNALDIEILRVLPFDSDRKMMSVVIRNGAEFAVLTKGAPDVVLTRTSHVEWGNESQPLAPHLAAIEAQVLDFANAALRTLAVTWRTIDENLAKHGTVAELETDLTLLGVAGIIDPPRPEVKTSVNTLHQAGVQVVMITGDHAATARAIALRLGIVADPEARVVTGRELNTMDDAELAAIAPDIRVYARVTPAHKQRIIRALQAHQEVVAMTGDGINDAPALRAADIGIAMGITGTAVTKDAADLILLDDKFTTIETAVRAGRTIFATIKNFMRHELVTNVAEVLALLLGAVFITQPIGRVAATTPTLTALMVLWVNMISDALPSFALGYDTAEADVMHQPPRNTHQPLLQGMLGRIALRGTVMGVTVLVAFMWAANAGFSASETQTVAFLTLVFGQLWHVFDARASRTLFRRNPFDNGRLLLAVGFAGSASLLITQLPFFNLVMGTAPLPGLAYAAVIFLPALPTFILSGIKELWWGLRGPLAASAEANR